MKKIVLGIGAVLLLLVVGFLAANIFFMSSSSAQLSEMGSQASLSNCKNVKQNACAVDGGIEESDYPETCFENGEHVLDNPYTCG